MSLTKIGEERTMQIVIAVVVETRNLKISLVVLV